MVQRTIAAGDAREARLQPPGAGLPWAERMLSRLGVWLLCRRLSREAASRWFADEGKQIVSLATSLPAEQAARQVLIPRIWGIEDSSRNWSVLMTLDHLVIVNSAMAEVIECLAAGRAYPGVSSTADVKPGLVQDAGVIDRFTECVAEYPQRIAAIANLHTKLRHAHPWFGPLSGHEWHCLAAAHMRIHRRQIERIAKLL